MDDGELGLSRGGDGDIASLHSDPQVSLGLGPMQMSATCILAAGLEMGTPRINTFNSDATPGKTKVSFKQWYHEVQCIKDHYPEAVVWEIIIRSLKRAVADMARYMGPTASVAHILHKHSVIFGMQNFYKVTQDNNKKVPSFATKLERILNQI